MIGVRHETLKLESTTNTWVFTDEKSLCNDVSAHIPKSDVCVIAHEPSGSQVSPIRDPKMKCGALDDREGKIQGRRPRIREPFEGSLIFSNMTHCVKKVHECAMDHKSLDRHGA